MLLTLVAGEFLTMDRYSKPSSKVKEDGFRLVIREK
jgi:hypothetical protein